MTNNIVAIFAWLGGSFFCGIIPLGIAAILFFSARKRGQVGAQVGSAKKSSIAGLRSGGGLVRLQGQIAPQANPIDSSPENAMVHLRLRVEIYMTDSSGSGWRGAADKTRSVPFQLQDGSGSIRIDPTGLDKHLLGAGIVPDGDQAQAACILLGIPIPHYHNPLRYRMWELRSGQTITAVAPVCQGLAGLEVKKVQGQPFILSPLLGQALDAQLATQTKNNRTWTYILGIPGAIMLVCTLGGAFISLVRALTTQ